MSLRFSGGLVNPSMVFSYVVILISFPSFIILYNQNFFLLVYRTMWFNGLLLHKLVTC